MRGESEFCIGKGKLETWRGDIKNIAECVGLYIIAADGQACNIACVVCFCFEPTISIGEGSEINIVEAVKKLVLKFLGGERLGSFCGGKVFVSGAVY